MAEWHSTKQTDALRTSISGDTHTALTLFTVTLLLLDACVTHQQARLFVCVRVCVLENNKQNDRDLETTRETHV